MQFDDLERKNLIVKIRINFRQIYNYLDRAEKDLLISKTLLSQDEE